MPPSQSGDAIVIALDVGKSVSTLQYWEKKTFFELAKDCVSRIIQRKIISESKDKLSIILIGSDDTDNPLRNNDYKNICCKFDFQLTSWDMLKFIESEIKTTDIESDWMGALIVSMEMLKSYEEYNKIDSKRIVILSDFAQSASDDLDVITRSIKALNIQVTIIGPDACNADEGEPEVKRRRLENEKASRPGEKVVYELWKKVSDNIIICNFEAALKQLCSYIRKTKRVTCWNCILDIGDVKINISMFKKTEPKAPRKFSTKCTKPTEDQSEPGPSRQSEQYSVIRDKVLHYKHETGDGNEFLDVEVKPEDTIEGYRYGTTVIPFSEEDKAALEFKSGPKAFSVIGFTNISSVPYYLLSGDCSYIVLPRDKDQNSEVALSAIIQAMKKMECVAVVRKVQYDNSRLALGILYPVIEEIVCDETEEVTVKEFLLFVELAFEEDVKLINFPSLERVAKGITEEQFEAVDNLIDGMDLMEADRGLNGESCEAFELSNLHDLKEQFYHYCVVQRGLHPEKPLPSSIPKYIEEFTKPPKSVEEKTASLLGVVKERFKIELNRKPETVKSNQEGDKTSDPTEKLEQEDKKLEHFTEADIREETDATKSGWLRLFGKGFPVDSELDRFFQSHSDPGKTEKSKILKCFQEVIEKVRQMYLKINPDAFNWWMTRFRGYAVERKGLQLDTWEVIVAENMGLISKKENRYSNVSKEAAEKFLLEVGTSSAACYSPANKKTDFGPVPELLSELEAEQMAIDSLY